MFAIYTYNFFRSETVSELNLVLYDYSFKVYGDDWWKTYIFIAVEQSIILII